MQMDLWYDLELLDLSEITDLAGTPPAEDAGVASAGGLALEDESPTPGA